MIVVKTLESLPDPDLQILGRRVQMRRHLLEEHGHEPFDFKEQRLHRARSIEVQNLGSPGFLEILEVNDQIAEVQVNFKHLQGEPLGKVEPTDFGEYVLDDEVRVHQTVLGFPNLREVALMEETVENCAKKPPEIFPLIEFVDLD
jgi:hypothetical protein